MNKACVRRQILQLFVVLCRCFCKTETNRKRQYPAAGFTAC